MREFGKDNKEDASCEDKQKEINEGKKGMEEVREGKEGIWVSAKSNNNNNNDDT